MPSDSKDPQGSSSSLRVSQSEGSSSSLRVSQSEVGSWTTEAIADSTVWGESSGSILPKKQAPVGNRMLGAQDENSLFSSSMSELFSQKLRFSSSNALIGHSAETVAYEGEEPFQSLEEMEAQTIGDLLPKDDDLLSGMIDSPYYSAQPYKADDLEELDFFGSIGGMDLGDDGSACQKILESPHRSSQKFVEFRDVRAAEAARQALNRSSIAEKQFRLEPSHPGGTGRLAQLPSEINQDNFVQFMQQSNLQYDAITGFTGSLPRLASIPGCINTNNLGINSAARAPVNPLLEGLPRGLQSHLRLDSFGKHFEPAESSQHGHLFDIQGTSNFHARSLPEYNYDLANSSSAGTMIQNPRREIIDNRQQIHGVNLSGHVGLKAGGNYNFDPATGNCSVPRHIAGSNSYYPQPPARMRQNLPSPSFVNNLSSHPPQTLHGLQRTPVNLLSPALPANKHHVGSAPSMSHNWDRRQLNVGELPDASCVYRGFGGSTIMFQNTLQPVDSASYSNSPPVSGSCMDLSSVNQPHQQKSMLYPGRSQIPPMINPIDPPTGCDQSRRNENCSSQADKKQFELDIERIMRGEDSRTTLMIKNIPNKYTSRMLLAAVDEHHKGTFDFIYLPIDFKNKCNVGYAFINMTDPKHIIPLYQTFNGKKWEKFNSEKVASIAYARIQGKAALVAHFQNSSLMNEDKRCRPILFNTEGPNAGDQVPFPTGANIKSRRAKSRSNTYEGQQESSNVADENIWNSVNKDSSSASVK